MATSNKPGSKPAAPAAKTPSPAAVTNTVASLTALPATAPKLQQQVGSIMATKPSAPAPVAAIISAKPPTPVVAVKPAKKVAPPAKAKPKPVKAAVKPAAAPAKLSAKPALKPAAVKSSSPANPVQKAINLMPKGFEEITAAASANAEALVKASTKLFKLAEDVNRSWLSYVQSAVEKHLTASKELLSVKTLPELLEKQSKYAKTSYDALLAEATKNSELAVKEVSAALAPINARVTETVERIVKIAA
jgi:phasin family protein